MSLSKIKDDVFHEMRSIKLWGNQFTANCLPASLQALDRVKLLHPHAKVVIGTQTKNNNLSIAKHPIVLFKDAKIDSRPTFHAWIDLGNGDVFDMVGPSWNNKSEPYWDRATARKYCKGYYPILESTFEVYRFYVRLKWLQKNRKYKIKYPQSIAIPKTARWKFWDKN